MFPRCLSNSMADWFDWWRGQKHWFQNGIKHEIVSFSHATVNHHIKRMICLSESSCHPNLWTMLFLFYCMILSFYIARSWFAAAMWRVITRQTWETTSACLGEKGRGWLQLKVFLPLLRQPLVMYKVSPLPPPCCCGSKLEGEQTESWQPSGSQAADFQYSPAELYFFLFGKSRHQKVKVCVEKSYLFWIKRTKKYGPPSAK